MFSSTTKAASQKFETRGTKIRNVFTQTLEDAENLIEDIETEEAVQADIIIKAENEKLALQLQKEQHSRLAAKIREFLS